MSGKGALTYTPRTLDESDVRAAIVRAVGKSFELEVPSIVPWARREMVADRYGSGRVFLTGDAAHLNSPTGAFGMNTGMQDSVDLGWKLAAMLQGWGGKDLLLSYEPERRPVALRNVEEASANLRRMLASRDKLSPLVFDAGHDAERARRAFGEAYTALMKQEWFTLPIHLGYRYELSPIVWQEDTPEPDLGDGGRPDRRQFAHTGRVLHPGGHLADARRSTAEAGEASSEVSRGPGDVMGRLAIDARHRRRGLGQLMMMDAFSRSLRIEIATFAFVVDAKDGNAAAFYASHGFLPLTADGRRMFVPMAEIAKLFA